jgi:hypothetical protein
VFFLEVTEEMVGINVGGEMILPSTGLVALIESIEDPLPYPAKSSEPHSEMPFAGFLP